jgi:threonine dehydratase
MHDLPVTAAAVGDAASAIAGAIVRTPAIAAPALSELVGAELHLKLETVHRTGSFKGRGALNKLRRLDVSQRRAGVVARSAGNHAQGVPTTPAGWHSDDDRDARGAALKIDRTEASGATVC